MLFDKMKWETDGPKVEQTFLELKKAAMPPLRMNLGMRNASSYDHTSLRCDGATALQRQRDQSAELDSVGKLGFQKLRSDGATPHPVRLPNGSVPDWLMRRPD
jgi:hypothetical protein